MRMETAMFQRDQVTELPSYGNVPLAGFLTEHLFHKIGRTPTGMSFTRP